MVKKRIRILCCIFWVFWASVCAAKDFIIDTDMSADDIMAIVYMLNQPTVHVKAITIAGDGGESCAPMRRNLLGLLQLMGRTNIPVACGRELSLSAHNHFPVHILNLVNDLFGAAKLLPHAEVVAHGSAVDLLHAILKISKHPVDVLAIGPLTNLADTLNNNPTLKNKIRHIYIMGGAVHVPGNLSSVDPAIENAAAEWNFYLNPEAADVVFRSGIPLTLVPLDLTNQTPIDKEFYHALERTHATPASEFVYELVKRNQPMLEKRLWYFWDPLAAVIATDESVAVMRKEKIQIVVMPQNKSGATVESERGNLVDVCESVDQKRFKQMLLHSITAS